LAEVASHHSSVLPAPEFVCLVFDFLVQLGVLVGLCELFSSPCQSFSSALIELTAVNSRSAFTVFTCGFDFRPRCAERSTDLDFPLSISACANQIHFPVKIPHCWLGLLLVRLICTPWSSRCVRVGVRCLRLSLPLGSRRPDSNLRVFCTSPRFSCEVLSSSVHQVTPLRFGLLACATKSCFSCKFQFP
jgi:hypothetical protein